MATGTKLNLESLGLIDAGRVKALVDMGIEQIAQDIDDRAAMDGSKRSLILKVEFSPQISEGVVQDVDVEFSVEAKVPARRSRVYRMDPRAKGFLFNPENRTEPRQKTIDEAGNDD
jgi:hypothetical protein